MLIGIRKHCQKLLFQSSSAAARFEVTTICTKQTGFPLHDSWVILTENNDIINERQKKNIDKYPLLCMIVDFHSFIASDPLPSLPPQPPTHTLQPFN